MSPYLSSNKRVAVITAANLGYHNTGMLTVDLAFEAIRKQLGESITANWYTLHPPTADPIREYVQEADLPFNFQPLTEHLNEIYEYDAVVFWGDFLQTRHYMDQDATYGLLKFGLASDHRAARTILHRSLLLRDASDELLSRTILYGGTILHNSQANYADEDYGAAFTRLLTRSRAVWMREPLSAAKVAHLRQYDGLAQFGADAALLLRPADFQALPTTGWADMIPKNEVAAVFLGTRSNIPSWMPSFCRRLAKRLDTRLEWLPWFDTRTFYPEHIETRSGQHTFGDIIASLTRYKLIITDTYHLCVNAWRAGTPAVCVGSPQPSFPPANTPADSPVGFLSVNDLKKHIFHLAYDASDFYVSTARSTNTQRSDQFERLAQLLESGFEPIARRMRSHAGRSEADFTQILTSVLSPTRVQNGTWPGLTGQVPKDSDQAR